MATPTTRPLLSASLIVKDEEEMLPRCLAALEGIVDEIVVLDTGSTDRTVEIAEAAGATVHHAEWHDDFARARNESLSQCSGRWVIFVDADEVLQVDDAVAFRRDLARTREDAFSVHIENVVDHGGSINFTHDPVRLFRRTRFTFEGRIHEHVVPLSNRTVGKARCTALTIRHFGYAPAVLSAKNKFERNVRLARSGWEANPDDVLARIELARSLSATPQHSETMEHLEVLRALGGEPRKVALHLGIKVLIQMGSPEEALEWAEEIRRDGSPTVNSTKLHAETLFRLGRYEDALEILDEVPEEGVGTGVHGTHESATAVKLLRVRVLSILGCEEEAADLAVDIASYAPDELWPKLITLLRRRGELDRAVGPFLEGLRLLGESRARGVLAELSKGPVELGDAFFEVLAGHPEGLPYGLAFALSNAERLTTERAAAWSAVARAARLDDSCPLLRQMDALSVPTMRRIMAASMVLGSFDDDRGAAALERSASGLADDEVTEAIYVVAELVPTALMQLVAGYVTSQRRALIMADALVELGAHEQAVAVLHHGLETCDDDAQSGDRIAATLAQLEPLV